MYTCHFYRNAREIPPCTQLLNKVVEHALLNLRGTGTREICLRGRRWVHTLKRSKTKHSPASCQPWSLWGFPERLISLGVFYSLAIIWPGRRAGILRLGASSPLRPRVSSCLVLAAVLVSAEVASVGSVSPDAAVSSSKIAVSSWLDWTAGASVTLRRGSSGDLLIAGGNGVLAVVVFGCTCSRLRLRNLFRGLAVVARAGGGLVSAGAWRTDC